VAVTDRLPGARKEEGPSTNLPITGAPLEEEEEE
jgi:hypothetical protein